MTDLRVAARHRKPGSCRDADRDVRTGRTQVSAARIAAWLALLSAASCATPSIDWRDGADPAPSGSGYLRAYKESHFRDLGQEFVASLDWSAFVARVRGARVLLLGDRHDDAAWHERLDRLLDRLEADGIAVALGLEAIGSADEIDVELFLRGRTTLGELRTALRARWADNWLDSGAGVDSAFYARLLQRARRTRSPVFALEPVPRLDLSQRDAVIARRIARAADLHADRLIVVVVGEAHLCGDGALIERTARPTVALAASPSRRLAERRARHALGGAFLVTDRGVLFADRL